MSTFANSEGPQKKAATEKMATGVWSQSPLTQLICKGPGGGGGRKVSYWDGMNGQTIHVTS